MSLCTKALIMLLVHVRVVNECAHCKHACMLMLMAIMLPFANITENKSLHDVFKYYFSIYQFMKKSKLHVHFFLIHHLSFTVLCFFSKFQTLMF